MLTGSRVSGSQISRQISRIIWEKISQALRLEAIIHHQVPGRINPIQSRLTVAGKAQRNFLPRKCPQKGQT